MTRKPTAQEVHHHDQEVSGYRGIVLGLAAELADIARTEGDIAAWRALCDATHRYDPEVRDVCFAASVMTLAAMLTRLHHDDPAGDTGLPRIYAIQPEHGPSATVFAADAHEAVTTYRARYSQAVSSVFEYVPPTWWNNP